MSATRVLVIGSAGQLGRQLVATFAAAGYDVVEASRRQLDLADPDAGRVVTDAAPRLVVNAAAWTNVDGCAKDPERAMELNGRAPGRLARATREAGAAFCQVSTNEVFDGIADTPYDEDATPSPINPYGASKLAGEVAVRDSGVAHLIVRTAWIFGPGEHNFPARITGAARRAIAAGTALRVVGDELGNPTWAPALASAILAAHEAGLDGTLHLAGEPPVSRLAWAREILAGLPGLRLEEITADEYPRPAPVPRRAVLAMNRARQAGLAPIGWQEATRSYTVSLHEGAG